MNTEIANNAAVQQTNDASPALSRITLDNVLQAVRRIEESEVNNRLSIAMWPET
ncbi:hypothetical protein WME73_39485 [Sorangium sp. So ce302]|uniref:hypothetical protein n=1 Tax=unclassified Sorangium TaxID=2621164 RepID=UPI003F63B465